MHLRQPPTKAWILLLGKHGEATQHLQNAKSTTTRNFAWSLDFATAVVVKNIRSSTKEIRIAVKLVIDAAIPHVAPQQGIFAAFGELDAKIFGGQMKEAVFLKWSRLDGPGYGKTSTPGTINPRATIELDERLMHGPRTGLVLMLLHQMIHAYFLVCCAPPKVAGFRDLRLEHNRHFCMVMYSVLGLYVSRQNQSPRRRNGRPESMAYRGREVGRSALDSHDARHAIRFRRHHLEQSSNTCSLCSEPFQCEIPSNSVRQWFEEECADIDVSRADKIYTLTETGMEAQQRIKAEAGSNFVEFVWDKKAFKVPRAGIEANLSLKLRLARQKDDRELYIPPCSEETFRSLYSFTRTGGYGPELMKVQNNKRKAPAFSSTAGPPEILETRKDWPDFLGTDIRAVKLAGELGFYEMERYGLRRLSAQHFTHNDPIAALEAVYEGAWVPDGLRDWVVSFMAKPLSCRLPGQREQCNLDLLQQNLSFTASMARLMERSGGLREDVRRAEAKIARSSLEPNDQMAMVLRPPVPPVNQPSYHFPSDISWRRNPTTLPPSWWSETRNLPYSFTDPIDARAILTPPLTPGRLSAHGCPSPYGYCNGPLRSFGNASEPSFAERDEYWEQFH